MKLKPKKKNIVRIDKEKFTKDEITIKTTKGKEENLLEELYLNGNKVFFLGSYWKIYSMSISQSDIPSSHSTVFILIKIED